MLEVERVHRLGPVDGEDRRPVAPLERDHKWPSRRLSPASASRAPSQSSHSGEAKARSLGELEGGVWRRVIAGQKPA
jgi:hypothetical protein